MYFISIILNVLQCALHLRIWSNLMKMLFGLCVVGQTHLVYGAGWWFCASVEFLPLSSFISRTAMRKPTITRVVGTVLSPFILPVFALCILKLCS